MAFRCEADIAHIVKPIKGLVVDEHQARRHLERDVAAIAASLSDHGQKTPIVVERATMSVKKGNGTVMAARSLGWDRLAQVWSDDDEESLRKYALRDNRTAELSLWDPERLLEELTELGDHEELGWCNTELIELEDAVNALSIDPEIGGRDSGGSAPIKRNTVVSISLLVEDVAVVERALDAEVEKSGSTRGEALVTICSGYLGGGDER